MKKFIYSRIAPKYIFNAGLLAACLCAGTAHAEKFSIQSDSFKDGQKIPVRYAGTEQQCGSGAGVSPHVRWSHLPPGTASLAIFLNDPDGQRVRALPTGSFITSLPPSLSSTKAWRGNRKALTQWASIPWAK